jgi:SOS-response transcriptional repressor LexA
MTVKRFGTIVTGPVANLYGMSERAERLKQARINSGFDRPADAAARFGWNVNTYKSNENGNATFSFARAKDYAKAFGVRAEWLYDASGPSGAERPGQALEQPPIGAPISLEEVRAFIKERNTNRLPPPPAGRLRRVDRRIPVVGEVAAGLWRETVAREVDEDTEYLALDVAGYERAELRAMRVVGPSMNLIYPEGRYVVIAHPAEAGMRIGDIVVVERYRSGLVEITLKELSTDADGRLVLMPRSTHADYQTPIPLKEPDSLDQTAPQIVGIVVADFSRRERPPAFHSL